MTYEQKRMLVEDVFGCTTSDGRRMGVYVTPIDTERNAKHRRYRYQIRGRIEWGGVLKDCVTSNARYYKQKPSSRRSAGGSFDLNGDVHKIHPLGDVERQVLGK